MNEKDTLVGDVSMMCEGGVNPIGGDGQDDAIISHDERRLWAVCHYWKGNQRHIWNISPLNPWPRKTRLGPKDLVVIFLCYFGGFVL